MNKEKNRKVTEKRPQEEKFRRKDARMIDNVLKGMETMEEPEKLQGLIAKYTELYEEYRNSQNALYAEQKKNATAQQENEHLTSENNKLVLVRNRLEKLSREFQRQNKILKEENLVKIKEEEERRRQITVEFQKALGNVTNMMAESNDQNCKLGEENKNMAKRLSSIYEEVKNRQTEVDRFSKQIAIERQLAETRFAKVSTEFLIEKEKLNAEKVILMKRAEHLTLELRSSLEKSISLEKTIAELRGQLNGYTGRYEEFQKTISKSSKIFDQCKSEIANMNDQIYNQKKELLEWQTKHQKNLTTIRDLSVINDQKGKFIDQINRKQLQLAKLCRHLQAERTAYMNALRTNGHNPDDFVANLAVDETEPEVDTFKPDLTPTSVGAKVEKEKLKRGKQKSKEKTKDAKKELHNELFKLKVQDCPVMGKDPLAVKEMHLAELKEELKRMQSQVDKIQSDDNKEVTPTETSPKEEQKDVPKEEATEVSSAEKDVTPIETNPKEELKSNEEILINYTKGDEAAAVNTDLKETSPIEEQKSNEETLIQNQTEVSEVPNEEVAQVSNGVKPKETSHKEEPSSNGEILNQTDVQLPKEEVPELSNAGESVQADQSLSLSDVNDKEIIANTESPSQTESKKESTQEMLISDQQADQVDQTVAPDKTSEVIKVQNDQENGHTDPIEEVQ